MRQKQFLIVIFMLSLMLISCSGDYKRVEISDCDLSVFSDQMERQMTLANLSMRLIERIREGQSTGAVSYTHLTLPTIYSV